MKQKLLTAILSLLVTVSLHQPVLAESKPKVIYKNDQNIDLVIQRSSQEPLPLKDLNRQTLREYYNNIGLEMIFGTVSYFYLTASKDGVSKEIPVRIDLDDIIGDKGQLIKVEKYTKKETDYLFGLIPIGDTDVTHLRFYFEGNDAQDAVNKLLE